MQSDSIQRLNAALSGRYAVERVLGAGGMATVYLARDLKHKRQVAIKVVRPELSSVLGRDRFLREIEVAARLSHPRIVALYDSGDAAGLLYYVMPWIGGESLRQKLRREGPLPVDEAVRITRDIAIALDYAHERGVVHRDIKPENVLFHEGEPLLADFGVALATDALPEGHLTGAGLVVGTPDYMSPEQVAGERALDARSDVYGLACVLYEMLAGEPPWKGPGRQAAITRRVVESAPPVGKLRPTVPPHVERALARALARLPADRYPSAGEFAGALVRSDALTGGGTPRVAVLPFLNLSADPENEYFADGITEDVIAHLSRIRALDVIARASVMPFKTRAQGLREIADRLGTRMVLDGSVRRAGDRVRIVAHLVDADTEQDRWSETYDRQLTDIFAIQTDVALHIAQALEARLTHDEHRRIRKEPTHDIEAYQLYVQGRHFLLRYTQDGMRRGIAFFENAAERDPDYALPWIGIAMAHIELGESGSGDPRQAYRKAKEAATKALTIDSGLGEAHCALAYLRAISDFDWEGAELGFKRALELGPGSADTYDLYGRVCGAQERYDEALSLQRRAQELDPLAHRSDPATTLLRAGRHEEALEAALRAVDFDPGYDRARATLGWAYLRTADTEKGFAELERAAAMTPESTMWRAQLGQACGLYGRTAEARRILAELDDLARTRYVSPYHLAYVHVGLGEHDAALDLLERAVEQRAGAVYGIRGSFLFAPLRRHPRFRALLATMNLG